MSAEREPSVMARLMGLDEIPIQRHVQKKARVLSDNYLCRVSSIGVRKKCSDQQAFKFSIEQHDKYKNVLQVLENLSRKKHHTMTVVNAEMLSCSSELNKRNVIPKDTERQCFSRNGVHSNLQVGHLGMFKSSCDSDFMDIRKCGTFRMKSEVKFGVHFSGECCTVDTGEFWRSIPNSRIVQKNDRKRSSNGIESVRPRFRKERTKFAVEQRSELSGSDYFAKEPDLTEVASTSFCDRKRQINCSGKSSYTAGKVKKHISERWKTTKRFEVVAGRRESSSRSLLDCFNSVRSSDSNSTRQESFENGEYMSDLESVNSMQNETREQAFNYEMPEYDISLGNYVVKDDQEGNKFDKGFIGLSAVITQSPSNYDKHQSESINCIFSEKREDSSLHIRKASHVQEMSNETFEEDSVSSQDTDPESESLVSFEEASQPSPNSVLDRLGKRDISSSTDCFKSVNASLHGLHMQLELLKAKTSETYSVGSGMAVSSDDDDNREGSVNEYSEENQALLMSPLRVEAERREFSYLVDVLTEAGFQSRKKNIPKCPISYSVFEKLEKKYGEEQISWKRSERRLLFDRINLSLSEILQPFKGTATRTKSVAKRLRFSNGDEMMMMEEGVWALLVNEEEELKKETEKMLGKDDRWMELGDVIEEIGREIEDCLVDELLADVY